MDLTASKVNSAKGEIFSEEYFNFGICQLCLTFVSSKNIWAILENLSREIKNLNLYICKVSLRKCAIKDL